MQQHSPLVDIKAQLFASTNKALSNNKIFSVRQTTNNNKPSGWTSSRPFTMPYHPKIESLPSGVPQCTGCLWNIHGHHTLQLLLQYSTTVGGHHQTCSNHNRSQVWLLHLNNFAVIYLPYQQLPTTLSIAGQPSQQPLPIHAMAIIANKSNGSQTLLQSLP